MNTYLKVEFVGGPLDGHQESVRANARGFSRTLVVPVSRNVFKLIAGVEASTGKRSRITSLAVYELKTDGDFVRYVFSNAKPPDMSSLRSVS